jgi:apolipoprotein N-acyltransferase
MNQAVTKSLPWIAVIVGGILTFLGYAGFDQFYLEWICLVPVLWAIRGQPPVRAFFMGWLAGIVAHSGGFYWIIYMLQQFAAMAWPLAAFGLVLVAAANGFVFAAWAGATRYITEKTGWSIVLVSPVIWTALEKFWPEVFPNYLGASQYKLTYLTQIADVTGVLGVSFLVVYINSVIFWMVEQRLDKRPFSPRPAMLFAAVIALVIGYGAVRVQMVDHSASAADKLKVALVQTNLDASQRYNGTDRFLREHQEFSREIKSAGAVDLIMWPENICFLDQGTLRQAYLSRLIGDVQIPTLFGAITHIDQATTRRFYNSAVLVDGSGMVQGTYEKMVLVPLGEYIPLGDIFPVLYSWSPHSSRLWPGENVEPLQLGKHLISVSVCYEDIFPGQINKLMEGGRDRRVPEAMFNMTDDSWYGNTVEPTEHLALATFRSIEHRRSLVRTTNTGISAIVDPAGRITQSIGQWTKGSLVGEVPMMQGRTIYAVMGDWFGYLCIILALAGIGRSYQLTRKLGEVKKTAPGKARKKTSKN